MAGRCVLCLQWRCSLFTRSADNSYIYRSVHYVPSAWYYLFRCYTKSGRSKENPALPGFNQFLPNSIVRPNALQTPVRYAKCLHPSSSGLPCRRLPGGNDGASPPSVVHFAAESLLQLPKQRAKQAKKKTGAWKVILQNGLQSAEWARTGCSFRRWLVGQKKKEITFPWVVLLRRSGATRTAGCAPRICNIQAHSAQ